VAPPSDVSKSEEEVEVAVPTEAPAASPQLAPLDEENGSEQTAATAAAGGGAVLEQNPLKAVVKASQPTHSGLGKKVRRLRRQCVTNMFMFCFYSYKLMSLPGLLILLVFIFL